MAYPERKYRKGFTIFSLDELSSRLMKGEWVYFRDKVLHPGFIRNMTFHTVLSVLNARAFHEAIDQHKEYSEKASKCQSLKSQCPKRR